MGEADNPDSGQTRAPIPDTEPEKGAVENDSARDEPAADAAAPEAPAGRPAEEPSAGTPAETEAQPPPATTPAPPPTANQSALNEFVRIVQGHVDAPPRVEFYTAEEVARRRAEESERTASVDLDQYRAFRPRREAPGGSVGPTTPPDETFRRPAPEPPRGETRPQQPAPAPASSRAGRAPEGGERPPEAFRRRPRRPADDGNDVRADRPPARPHAEVDEAGWRRNLRRREPPTPENSWIATQPEFQRLWGASATAREPEPEPQPAPEAVPPPPPAARAQPPKPRRRPADLSTLLARYTGRQTEPPPRQKAQDSAPPRAAHPWPEPPAPAAPPAAATAPDASPAPAPPAAPAAPTEMPPPEAGSQSPEHQPAGAAEAAAPAPSRAAPETPETAPVADAGTAPQPPASAPTPAPAPEAPVTPAQPPAPDFPETRSPPEPEYLSSAPEAVSESVSESNPEPVSEAPPPMAPEVPVVPEAPGAPIHPPEPPAPPEHVAPAAPAAPDYPPEDIEAADPAEPQWQDQETWSDTGEWTEGNGETEPEYVAEPYYDEQTGEWTGTEDWADTAPADNAWQGTDTGEPPYDDAWPQEPEVPFQPEPVRYDAALPYYRKQQRAEWTPADDRQIYDPWSNLNERRRSKLPWLLLAGFLAAVAVGGLFAVPEATTRIVALLPDFEALVDRIIPDSVTADAPAPAPDGSGAATATDAPAVPLPAETADTAGAESTAAPAAPLAGGSPLPRDPSLRYRQRDDAARRTTTIYWRPKSVTRFPALTPAELAAQPEPPEPTGEAVMAPTGPLGEAAGEQSGAGTIALDGPAIDVSNLTAGSAADIGETVAEIAARVDRSEIAPVVESLRALIIEYPDDPRVLRQWGRVQLARNDPGAAAQAFEQTLKSEPDDRQARLGLGFALLAGGLKAEAGAEADTLIAASPDFVPAHLLRAEALGAIGALELGLEECAIVEGLDSMAGTGQWCRGAVYKRAGRFLEAQEFFSEALTIAEPDFVRSQQRYFRFKGYDTGQVDGINDDALLRAVTKCSVARDCMATRV